MERCFRSLFSHCSLRLPSREARRKRAPLCSHFFARSAMQCFCWSDGSSCSPRLACLLWFFRLQFPLSRSPHRCHGRWVRCSSVGFMACRCMHVSLQLSHSRRCSSLSEFREFLVVRSSCSHHFSARSVFL